MTADEAFKLVEFESFNLARGVGVDAAAIVEAAGLLWRERESLAAENRRLGLEVDELWEEIYSLEGRIDELESNCDCD